MKVFKLLLVVVGVCVTTITFAQPPRGINWSADGNSYYEASVDGIVKVQLPTFKETVVVSSQQLTPVNATKPLNIYNFFFSDDGKKMLIYTNSKKVWRYNTRGDYWVLDITNNSLKQIGKSLPVSSLMYAKFSPDGNNVAYVSNHNLYVENLKTGNMQQLTTDGTDRIINGTFDWVYEEEFDCRDGFRWSPDSKSIAYWKVDATKIPNYLMTNNTDSTYPFVKPVEYPVAGVDPSPCYVYVVNIANNNSAKMNIPGDPQQHYIPRMEWAANSSQLIIEQFNRKQNEIKLMYCDASTGNTNEIYTENDKAWIDNKNAWADDNFKTGWEWIKNGSAFLWVSEKDGWRHIYAISCDGKKETLLTNGNYDIITLTGYDDKTGYVYFMASPDNATQQYLFRVKMDGKGKAERLSPVDESGTHEYDLSPNGLYASHEFSNINTPPVKDWVSLPQHKIINQEENGFYNSTSHAEMFQVITGDGITMDGWMVKPTNFDSTKKYPVVFYVYSEPASQTVKDKYGAFNNRLYSGNMADDGYIYISVDGRGTPAPKGAAWRKAIYRNIGRVNIRDQAMAAKKIIQWPFIDTSRVAIWGWSGGGSTTLNCMFQYPEIYKTGISIAAVDYQLTYDNIYQERYMGLPQESIQDFIAGSPITYAKNLQGHLLIVHGTGDDNVHYKNAELMLNELIKYNKIFQFMPYPNRTHAINEGEGTSQHLGNLYTTFLKEYCPPGAK